MDEATINYSKLNSISVWLKIEIKNFRKKLNELPFNDREYDSHTYHCKSVGAIIVEILCEEEHPVCALPWGNEWESPWKRCALVTCLKYCESM